MPAYARRPGRVSPGRQTIQLHGKNTAEDKYTYTDEAGTPLFQVRRAPGKQFTQWSPNGDRWRPGLHGARRVLYRLPEIIEAVKRDRTIYLVEGEKDVERARALYDPLVRMIATTNPGGAGKWRDEYSEVLRGARRVEIIWDRDPAGRKHALAVADSLKRVGVRARFARAKVGNDLSDHLDAGYGIPSLVLRRPKAPKPKLKPARTTNAAVAAGGELPAMLQLVLLKLRDYAVKTGRKPPERHYGREAWEATCPTHDDERQSLGVALGDDVPVLLYCQAGCSVEEVVAALGIDWTEFKRARRA